MDMPVEEAAEHAAEQAAQWLREADALLITAGAGMGVDSGLPDFRGNRGFWRAYPALGQRGMRFDEIASPAAFQETPRLAWGFYGHRLEMYRRIDPHAGYGLLRDWGAALPQGAFVYTSNVDGHFAKAGFAADRIVECHRSIHHLQCLEACTAQVWSADDWHPVVDEAACRAAPPLPTCPHCGAVARPNILMFNDWHWIEERERQQQALLDVWLTRVERLVVVELGAGLAIPTVRRFGERHGPRLVRINPDDCLIPSEVGIGLRSTALAGLRMIDARLGCPTASKVSDHDISSE
jgi:NAD-dependent SIR2 family protein deacetylase